jgi:phytoene dehydrogenase-like protein
VLVLERNAEPGGGLRTGEVTLPGVKHDLFATNLSNFAASPVYRELQRDLEAQGVRLLTNGFPFASVYAGGTAARVFVDRERTEQEFARHSPADRDGWRRAFRLFERVAPHALPLFFCDLPSREAAVRIARFAALRPGGALALRRILGETPRQFVDRFFATAEVKGLFTPWALHMDFGADTRGGAMFPFVAAMSGARRGLFLAEGGAGRIADALRVLIERAGGAVRTGAEVRRVRVERGAAVAVETGDGAISAGRAIVANVTPRRLFGALVAAADLPSGFAERVRGFRYGPGTFVIHLVLRRPLEWRAGPDLADFNYVHVNGGGDDIARTYAQSLAGTIPDRPLLIVSQTTPVDPTRAPAGQHVVRVHVRSLPAEIRDDAAGRIAARDWDAAKEPFAERVLDLVAEHAPNLRDALIASHAVSPADLERGNPNFVGGDCVSGSHHLDQNYSRRPLSGWTRHRTPIRRLYMIGASTWPGGGVHGASGYLLARRLLAAH